MSGQKRKRDEQENENKSKGDVPLYSCENSSSFSDITLIDKKEFPHHKWTLAQCSSVFHFIFSEDSKVEKLPLPINSQILSAVLWILDDKGSEHLRDLLATTWIKILTFAHGYEIKKVTKYAVSAIINALKSSRCSTFDLIEIWHQSEVLNLTVVASACEKIVSRSPRDHLALYINEQMKPTEPQKKILKLYYQDSFLNQISQKIKTWKSEQEKKQDSKGSNILDDDDEDISLEDAIEIRDFYEDLLNDCQTLIRDIRIFIAINQSSSSSSDVVSSQKLDDCLDKE